MTEPPALPEPAVAGTLAARRPGALGGLADLFRPEPPAAPIADEDDRRRAYFVWRWRMFLGFFAGYAVLYFARKNISGAAKPMGDALGLSNTELGLIGTTLYVTYGLGKFCNGLLADRSNIRVFMATGLIVSGLVNVLFASTATLWLMALVWGLNGWFQSMGFPPIARGMTLWYPPKGKATRWAFWTCSHQAGTAAIFYITAWILSWGDWRACFWLPGLATIAMGVVLLFLMGDTPESRGLASAQAFADEPEEDRGGDFKALFFKYVLKNRTVWVVGLIDLCVYVVRYGTLDWTAKFLVESKGYEKAAAAATAGVMPLAGVAGVLASGFLADALFRGRYKAVNAVSLAAVALCLFGFLESGPGSRWIDALFLAGIGFFIEGPQSILGGVGAVDAGGSARVASSAAGLVGILAYTGASLSGVGTGMAIDHLGWAGAFWFWIVCATVGLGLCLFAWKEKTALE